ncbi:MAG: heparinase II/III family protein, partial [Steroidobacteraceae bacterium]
MLWHTVRQLKPAQVINRVMRRFARRVATLPGGLTPVLPQGPWVAPVPAAPQLIDRDRISIHGHERDIGTAAAWSAQDVSQLWLYHLHYFDELAAPLPATGATAVWRRELVERWVRENPPAIGAGWDAYPVSLRSVNWIKWHLAGNTLSLPAQQSLATQLEWLAGRLEFHLLGNHLFENAKALCFGGCFFSGPAADGWWQTGARLLEREIAEQVLADGGHFELSPMYHARMLENVLDLLNLQRAFGRRLPIALEPVARRMLNWLRVMTHPDGGIVLFNDAALGQAPTLAELGAYADRLGLQSDAAPGHPVHWLPESGYGRVTAGPWVGFLDVAEIGPSYLPAHGHADALTFELSLDDERFVVDTGTQGYADGPSRW